MFNVNIKLIRLLVQNSVVLGPRIELGYNNSKIGKNCSHLASAAGSFEIKIYINLT